MAKEKQSRFENWLGKILYALIVGGRCEDYVHEQDGKIVRTPSAKMCASVLQSGKGSR